MREIGFILGLLTIFSMLMISQSGGKNFENKKHKRIHEFVGRWNKPSP